jgi:hypothetical protein
VGVVHGARGVGAALDQRADGPLLTPDDGAS